VGAGNRHLCAPQGSATRPAVWASGLDPDAIDIREVEAFKLRLDAILEETLKYWMKIKGAPDLERSLEAKAELGQKGH
jgi:hypothetical protein